MTIDIQRAIDTTTPGDTPQMARMRKARMSLQLRNPYLGMLAARLQMQQTMAPRGVVTVSVDSNRILFSQSFVDAFKTEEALSEFFGHLMVVAEGGDDVFPDTVKRVCAEAVKA